MKLHVALTHPHTRSDAAPLVVVVPDVRENLGGPLYDPLAQLLASQGYFVLTINPRGTRGAGIDYWAAGHRQLGRAIATDIEDCVRATLAATPVDPKRIAVIGDGTGGFLAWHALARTPELYACGVCIDPIADWAAYFREQPTSRWMRDEIADVEHLTGDPDQEKKFLRSISAASFAKNMMAPLLIFGPEKEFTPKLAQVAALENALKKAGKDPRVARLPPGTKGSSAHSFAGTFEQTIAFLAQHLAPNAAATKRIQ